MIRVIGGPPFHPNCSKSTAPIIPELATPARLEAGKPDPDSTAVAEMGVKNPEAVRYMKDLQVKQSAQARQDSVVEDIRRRAREAGYEPPPWSPGDAEVKAAKEARQRQQDEFILDPEVKAKLTEMGVANPDIGGLDKPVQQWVAEGISKAADLGLSPPPTIRTSKAEFRTKPNAIAKYTEGRITLNAGYPDLARLAERAMELGSGPNPVWSTTDPHHAILHEMVHHEHLGGMSDEERKRTIGSNRLTKEQKDVISREVGSYAARSRTNFVAEVTLGRKLARKTYSPAVMRWFLAYGGKP